MPANSTASLPVYEMTEPKASHEPETSPQPSKIDDSHAQFVTLQSAFRCVLSCAELRDADPPMLDVLDALTERFKDLLRE